MKLTIDTDARTLTVHRDGTQDTLGLYTAEAFQLLSDQWVVLGWQQKYSYRFTWLGRPIIQLPEDMIRIQEVIWAVRPDVIVETGVAHGGSLIFYASLCQVMDHGRVIGVDIEIRPHNRQAIAAHPLASSITLIEGGSTDPAIVGQIRALVQPGETVLVILDSNHTKAHVAAELEAYAPLVTRGSYIVATDGLMRDLAEVPGGRPEWRSDNPAAAALEFAARHPEFVLTQPAPAFNESPLQQGVTYWPQGWLKRI
jgi:cephalosporin hydroxylase